MESVREEAGERRSAVGRARRRPRSAPWAAGVALAAGLAAALSAAAPAVAQNGTPERVRVFLDCQTRGCDRQEFRTEITFVDWVRDRTVADVHVILTSQGTGGGQQFVFDFVGEADFEGQDLRLEESVSSTDSRDEELAGLVRTFKAGLVPYVARRGYLEEIEITGLGEPAAAAQGQQVPQDDPWDYWVFSLGADLEADGEEQQSNYEVSGRLNASRTTADWKINIGLDGSHEYERYELSGGTEEFDTDEWSFDALIVRSLTSHWSAGSMFEVNTSTSLNRDLGGRAAAALEWNLFPYEQANRRQFILHYQLGFTRVDYEEETIFEKTQESLFDQRLVAVYDTRQPWGNVSFSAEGSNYLHDFSQFSVALRGRTNFRIFRGFNLQVQGNYEVIRDQLYIAAGELDDAEIIIQRRELQTGYEYSIDIGFSYRFGSIYNNVVNNRFPWSVLGGGGGSF